MAQYGPFYADDYAVGTKLSDVAGFTAADDATSTDDIKVYEATNDGVTFRYWRPGGNTGNRIYTYDPAGDVHDMEMLCQFYVHSADSRSLFAIAQSDTPDSVTYYRFGLRGDAGGANVDAERFVNESFTGIAETSTSLGFGTYAYIRCQRDGSNLRIRKFGESGDFTTLDTYPSEPTSWDLETTDTGISADGKIGIGWRFDFGQAPVWFSFGTNGDPAPTEEPSGGTAVTDTAVITSAAGSILSASDTGLASDTATITAALASVLGSTDTGIAGDTATVTSAAASILAATDTGTALDNATLVTAQAMPLTASGTGIATDTAAIITATASPLTSSETTGTTTEITDTAQITSVVASIRQAQDTGIASDAASITAGAASVLSAIDATVGEDAAQVTGATVAILTSAETARALDQAVLVNAQGHPLAALDSGVTGETGQITTILATILTASDNTGTVEALYGKTRIVPVLRGSASLVARLSGKTTLSATLKGKTTLH